MFCRSLFIHLYFFFMPLHSSKYYMQVTFVWTLCCLSFFDLRFLITHLVNQTTYKPDHVTRRMPLAEQKLPTHPEHLLSHPSFSWVRVTRSLVFCVVFGRSLFVLLSFFIWPLCCLSFVDLRIQITHLVSPISSYTS